MDVERLSAFCARTEVRIITNTAEKAAVLIDKLKFESRLVREFLDVSKDRLCRARRAIRKRHKVGCSGKPRILSDKQEREVVKKIEEIRSAGDVMTLHGLLMFA